MCCKSPAGIAAKRDAAARDNRLPREIRGVPAPHVAGQLRRAREADELRDLRIGMKAREFVLMAVERIEYAPMLPAPGRIKILFVLGNCIDVGEGFIHAAVFLVEHMLHLCVV